MIVAKYAHILEVTEVCSINEVHHLISRMQSTGAEIKC